MTKLQRVRSVLDALFQFLFAGLVLFFDDFGYEIISIVIWSSLVLAAVRTLIYYFTMARHMVEGKSVLYQALILCDLAAFTGAVASIESLYIQIYLIVLFGVAGLIDLMRALDSRRMGADSWRFNAFHGFFNVLMALLCLLFLRNERIFEILYCVSLVNSAVLRLIAAFRKTAMVYVP